MDSIKSLALNFDSKIAGEMSGQSANKPTLLAYNDVNFNNLINNEIGMSRMDGSRNLTKTFSNQISDAKKETVDNNEYQNFVAKTKVRRSGIGHAKRKLSSFQPIPIGKTPYAAVKVESKQFDSAQNINENKFNVNNKIERFAGKGDPSDVANVSGGSRKDGLVQQIKQYKEDQLLSNPGGDNVFLNRESNVIDNSFDQSKFVNRVGKDLSDSLSNLKNMVKDLGSGREVKYYDGNGNIKSRKETGLLGTIGNFFKDIASGLSLGAYNPGNEEAPVGVGAKIKHLFKKVFVDAVGKDMFVGVPKSVINVGEDALFAGLNLAETIPDATIGNSKVGRNITTQVFDNIQVALDFGTDILPGGEASTRMKTMIAKKIKNMGNDGNTPEETETQYVRSTPFRKVIEAFSFFMPYRM